MQCFPTFKTWTIFDPVEIFVDSRYT